MTPRIGSLFSGYGGLDQGVHAVLGGSTAWVSDICRTPTDTDPSTHYTPHRGPCRILAHRLPNVPNLGDITTIDWSAVEPVDVLTGGFPCQDVSHAGKREGMRPDNRSGLWSQMAYAIDQLRPALVVAENVRGLLSAEAHSDVEPCPWCMGDGEGESPLRALGAVLGDLADLRYDAIWYGLRAADIGSCHGRFRVIVAAQDTDQSASREWRLTAPRQAAGGWPRPDAGRSGGVGTLLPTPAVNDMGAAYTPDEWDEWTDRMKAEHGNGNGHGKSLSVEAARLLPTPSVADVQGGRKARSGERNDEPLLNGIAHANLWGDYADAITRWETVLGRPAPAPTMTSTKGNPQLAPAFVEWMMGLPDGWVTDVPGITRSEALKALGNGVVPQQAEAALRVLLSTAVAA